MLISEMYRKSTDFHVEVDGKLLNPHMVVLQEAGSKRSEEAAEVVSNDTDWIYVPSGEGGSDSGTHLTISVRSRIYENGSLVERWIEIVNDGDRPARIGRIDPCMLEFPSGGDLMYYKSEWCKEFEPVHEPLIETKTLETRKGRSSGDLHPWFAWSDRNGQVVTASVLWSGNWIFRFERQKEGIFRVSGGMSDWEFHTDLQPGATFVSPSVAVAFGEDGSLNGNAQAFARVGREFWYPGRSLDWQLPVEWNTWWSYEDKAINEETFRRNVDRAAELGMEVCTLDAGWFGPSEIDAGWGDYRGDWHMVNALRFPSGLRSLSDYTHSKGLKFGIWCEIEAFGKKSVTAVEYPQYEALREGERLGYACFGSPEVREWAYSVLRHLITDYCADWIKIDFNLDPGAGCNRTDHGHGDGDGLHQHYIGLYEVFDRIRAEFPEVLLESCSSGGLRIDLGILQHVHAAFLSDPDWPEHSLQVFWGASEMLPPDACLHFSYSDWVGDHPSQRFKPDDPSLTPGRLDYFIRTGMLGAFGISQRLPILPDWVAERFQAHAALYRETIKRFVREADVYRLTEQPLRDGLGDRWAAFQYAMPDRSEMLLFVFRLDGGEAERTIRLEGLESDAFYALEEIGGAGDGGEAAFNPVWTGRRLMSEGLTFGHLPEENSSLIYIRRKDCALET